MNDGIAFWKEHGQAAARLCDQLRCAAPEQQDAIRQALAELRPEAAARLDWRDSAALLGSVAGCFQDDVRWRRLSAALPGPAAQPLDPTELAVGWQWLLGGFDQAVRRHHGAYFTPPTLARWMVAASLAILRQRRPEVRKDPSKLAVVDPAAGTGIFLQHWREQADPNNCVLGWELLPATAVVGDQLLRQPPSSITDDTSSPTTIHLGSALDIRDISPWVGSPSTLVVLGNPPYSNFRSVNAEQNADPCSAWMLELLADYKRGMTERKHNLHDDLIQFMRWGQHQIETVGQGLLAFVTNNTYLTGLTHRIMRQSLLRTFDAAYFLNLHGEQFQRDTAHTDENIFGIRQGVAVSIWFRDVASEHHDNACQCFYADVLGSRADKLETLERISHAPLASGFWDEFEPQAPSNRLRSIGSRGLAPPSANLDAYRSWPSLIELVREYVSGVQTKADRIFIHHDRATLECQIRSAMRAAKDADGNSGGKIRIHGIELALPHWLQVRMRKSDFDGAKIIACQVAPLDYRWLYYDPELLGRARYSVMRHVIRGKRGLVFMRQSKNPGDYDHFLMTNCPVTDRVFHSRHGAPFVAPWWLYDDKAPLDRRSHLLWEEEEETTARVGRQLNLTSAAGRLTGSSQHAFKGLLKDSPARESNDAPHLPGVGRFVPGEIVRHAAKVEPGIDIWHYIYAVAHATEYRRRFAAALSLDFPRIPPAASEQQFSALARLGHALSELHCSTSVADRPQIDAPPDDLLSWRVGGVDVVQRWQHQRRKSLLNASEQRHLTHVRYQAVETRRLITQVDQVFTLRLDSSS